MKANNAIPCPVCSSKYNGVLRLCAGYDGEKMVDTYSCDVCGHEVEAEENDNLDANDDNILTVVRHVTTSENLDCLITLYMRKAEFENPKLKEVDIIRFQGCYQSTDGGGEFDVTDIRDLPHVVEDGIKYGGYQA